MQGFDYCERLDASFFAEPFNAFSNVFFLLSAYGFYRFLQKEPHPPSWCLHGLLLILVAIGIGSFLWHTLASKWSELADVIPITLFIYGYLFCFLRRLLLLSPTRSTVYLSLFILLSTLFSLKIDPDLFNGSINYFPALFLLLLMSYRLHGTPYFDWMLASTLIFVLSIILRSLDFFACEFVPVGTHFLWHILNSFMLYLLLRLLANNSRNLNA